jgi:hypothetical protein
MYNQISSQCYYYEFEPGLQFFSVSRSGSVGLLDTSTGKARLRFGRLNRLKLFLV